MPNQPAPVPNSPARAARDGQSTRLFVREFLKSPLRTASLVPSSRALTTEICRPVHEWARDTPSGGTVVELGAGTGVFTRHIQNAIAADVHHLVVELNPTFAKDLRARFPSVTVVTENASDLGGILDRAQIDQVDHVVSALPWAAYAGSGGHTLLNAISGRLAPNGTFTQFTYSWSRSLPPGRRQRQLLDQTFTRVEAGGTVWANFPPAFVYTASAPRARG